MCGLMKCKNPYCKSHTFVAAIEMDTNVIHGLKCRNCGARYSIDEIEVKKSVKRLGWNSVRWNLEMPK